MPKSCGAAWDGIRVLGVQLATCAETLSLFEKSPPESGAPNWKRLQILSNLLGT